MEDTDGRGDHGLKTEADKRALTRVSELLAVIEAKLCKDAV